MFRGEASQFLILFGSGDNDVKMDRNTAVEGFLSLEVWGYL